MDIQFTKMHGLGNDFVVIDGINQTFDLTAETAARIANRHTGVGCDQILVVEKPESSHVEFKYRIFNADGSEVNQCGNGARCFARFARDKGLTHNSTILVETNAGEMTLNIEEQGVKVNMGVPQFVPAQIPMLADQEQLIYPIELPSGTAEVSCVQIGNPHAVVFVDDIDKAPVESWGPALESHVLFPERANIGFVQVIDKNTIKLRVFERGAGETQACGSGACAAAIAGIRRGLLNEHVHVELLGGTLTIQYAGDRQPVYLTGPASHVFEGTISLS